MLGLPPDFLLIDKFSRQFFLANSAQVAHAASSQAHTMATRNPGRQQKPQKQGKTDVRQQKRKQEKEDIQKLEQAVLDLVRAG